MKPLWIVPSLFTLCVLASPTMAQIKAKVQVKPVQAKKIQIKPIQGKKIQIKPVQAQPFRALFQQNDVILLGNKEVQTDLNLSKEQISKIKELTDNSEKAVQNLQGQARFKKLRELAEANKKAVEKILDEKQTTRIKQLQVQQMGPIALMNPNASKDLNLTEDQRKELRTIYQTFAPKRRDIVQQNKNDLKARQTKLDELNKQVTQELVNELTPEQKTTWTKMVGEPFKGTLPTRRGFAIGVLRPGGVGALPIQPRKIKIQPKKIQPQEKE